MSHMETEQVAVGDLRAHPRNYRTHPPDQLAHIIKSIEAHGFYRNVVIAKDNTILAGHGVVEASRKMGLDTVPVFRLDVEPTSPQALKVLTGDNEIGALADIDDRGLADILNEIKDFDIGELVGTGFDEQTLSALTFTVSPAEGVSKDFSAADREWTGLPAYSRPEKALRLVVNFATAELRDEFVEKHWGDMGDEMRLSRSSVLSWSTWWPPKQREDLQSVRFEEVGDDG